LPNWGKVEAENEKASSENREKPGGEAFDEARSTASVTD